VRAKQKQFTGTKLTPLEIKGLKKQGEIYRPKPKARKIRTIEDIEKSNMEEMKSERIRI
jgi:hypothetical protein